MALILKAVEPLGFNNMPTLDAERQKDKLLGICLPRWFYMPQNQLLRSSSEMRLFFFFHNRFIDLPFLWRKEHTARVGTCKKWPDMGLFWQQLRIFSHAGRAHCPFSPSLHLRQPVIARWPVKVRRGYVDVRSSSARTSWTSSSSAPPQPLLVPAQRLSAAKAARDRSSSCTRNARPHPGAPAPAISAAHCCSKIRAPR